MQGADALGEVFAKVDGDNSGSISQEEFVRFCVAAAAKRSLKQKVITTKVARQLKLGNFLSSSEAQVRLVAFHRLITPPCRTHTLTPLINFEIMVQTSTVSPWPIISSPGTRAHAKNPCTSGRTCQTLGRPPLESPLQEGPHGKDAFALSFSVLLVDFFLLS
jgi:hypothetical protein